MSLIIQIPPSEIKLKLKNRLVASWDLWRSRTPDDLEQEKVLFFKFYFDFSTAIEHCIRGILFEHSSHEEMGSIIAQFTKPSADHLSFFLNNADLSCIITEKKYTKIRDFVDFDEYSDLIALLPYPHSKHDCVLPYEYSQFMEEYTTVRKNRNILAHGIEAMDNGTFTGEFLKMYFSSFVVIHGCYASVYRKNHDYD